MGIGTEKGQPYDINPASKWHKENGTYPTEESIIEEIATVAKALEKEGIEVLRPKNTRGRDQIFSRDIGFVIDDKFVIANMLEPIRQPEIEGIQWIIDEIDEKQIVRIPKGATVEGGDVIVHHEHVFVGISKRTNMAGFEYLRSQFPNKTFHAVPVKITDHHLTNILHLDCTFQPIGKDMAIIYEDGFKDKPEIIYEIFPENKLIKVSRDEMNQMYPNIFSISSKKVLVEKSFTRLISELNQRDIETIPVKYAETSKLSGLLRCSTLPLLRT